MVNLISCSICGHKHQGIETSLCDDCIKKYTTAFSKVMDVTDAENLVWLLGNMRLNSDWNCAEVVKHQDRLDELSLTFKKHDHKNGNVVTYL